MILVYDIAWFCVLVWLFFWCGRPVVSRLTNRKFDAHSTSSVSSAEQAWLSSTTGLGLFSLGVFAMGIPHQFTKGNVFVVIAVLFGFSLRSLLTCASRLWHSVTAGSRCTYLEAGACLLTAIPCLLAFGAACAPEVRGDSIIYHISAALLYVVNHGHVEIPSAVLTYIPQGQQLLYALGLLLGSDSLARMIHWYCGVLLLCGVFVCARRMGCSRVGVLCASGLVALHPTWFYLASATMIDLATANYLLAAVALVAFHNTLTSKKVVLAGLLSGFALGTKYTAGVIGVLPLIALFLFPSGTNSTTLRKKMGLLVLFCLCASLPFVPWLLRNFLWTGNPIAPVAMGILGPGNVPRGTLSWPDIQAGNPRLFLSPLSLVRAYVDMLMAFGNFGYHIHFVALFLSISAWRTCGPGRAFSPVVKSVLLFLILAYLIGVPLGAVRSDWRYVMTHMGLLSVLSVYWVSCLATARFISLKRIHTLTAVAFLFLGVAWAVAVGNKVRDLNEVIYPVASKEAREKYLEARLQDYQANHALSDSKTDPGKRILGAAYPAHVHYVLRGMAIRPEFSDQEVDLLRPDDIPNLQRAGIGYLFGEIHPSMTDKVRMIGEYGGKRLWKLAE